MSTTTIETQPTTAADPLQPLAGRVLQALRGSAGDRMVETLLLVNILFLFARPQNDIPILATIQLPFILSIPLCIFWLTRTNDSLSTQTKAMLLLLIFGAIWVPFARNNFWAYHRVRALFLQFSCFIFPTIILCSNGRSMERLLTVLYVVGLYLGLYSIIYRGFGPGDFMGDENDFALVLTVLLCFPMLTYSTARSSLHKFLLIGLSGLLVVAIIATISRGGFIGLVCVLLYMFWKSESKLLYILIFSFMTALAALFAPPEYWDEVRSISETDSGTAAARRQIWSVARAIWLDRERPWQFFVGVGMGNAPNRLLEYEPAEHFSSSGKSIAGRAIHSLYFEMLPETGIFGLMILLTVVYSSYRGNVRLIKRSQLLVREISPFLKRRLQISDEQNSPDTSATNNLAPLLSQSASSLKRAASFANALNACWPGILTSGAFISIFYYPVIWFIGGLSATVQIFYQKMERSLLPLLEELKKESDH